MSKFKLLFLVSIIVIAGISSGCVGKKKGETAPISQPIVTPGTTISDKDLNTIESDLNDIDSIFNDSIDSDLIELGVNESSFT